MSRKLVLVRRNVELEHMKCLHLILSASAAVFWHLPVLLHAPNYVTLINFYTIFQ